MEQIIANILIASVQYILIGLGLSFIYRVSKCIDFSQGGMYLFGAYAAYCFSRMFHLSLPVAVLAAVLCSALLGSLVERCLYHQIRQKPNHQLEIILTSLGVLIIIQSTISLLFQDVTRSLSQHEAAPGLLVLGARVTRYQFLMMLVVLTICIMFWLAVQRTRWGLKVRAVANNGMLAEIAGIPNQQIIVSVAVIGSGLSGLAGSLMSLEIPMHPGIGEEALLKAVLVTLLAGHYGVRQLVIAGCVLACLETVVGASISLLWKETIAFSIVLLLLHISPKFLKAKKLEVVG